MCLRRGAPRVYLHFVRRDTRALGAPDYPAHFRAAILKPLCASAALDVFFQITSQPGVKLKQSVPVAPCLCLRDIWRDALHAVNVCQATETIQRTVNGAVTFSSGI